MRKLATLGARILRSNVGRNRRPFKLTLIVTWSCDTRCKMCNIWQRPKQGIMTLEEVEAFFTVNPRFSWVNLSGGEIWTRPDMDELMRVMIERSPDLYLVDFPTTGQLTDPIVAGVEKVLATRLPKLLVTVSLDGPREVHDEIRGREGAFDAAVETFRRLRALRPSSKGRFDCFLGMTLSNFNKGALFDTVEAVRAEIPDLELREFHVNLAQESAHYYQNEGMGRTEESALADLDEFLRRRGHRFHPVAWLERRYQKLTPGFLASGGTPLPCKALSSSIFVDPRWNVYPCSMYDAPLGSLRDHDFDLDRIWNADGTVKLQGEIASKRCPNCWTPCEAYQTILGNVLRPASFPSNGRPGGA